MAGNGNFPSSLAALMGGGMGGVGGGGMGALSPNTGASPGTDPDGDALPEANKVDPAIVVYMTGDQGPFQCQHCQYFDTPSSCDIVSGSIDPEGCCDLFTKGSGSSGSSQQPQP